MLISIEAIKNGFIVSLTNPMQPAERFFVSKWEHVLKMINELQISDGPPANNVVPLRPDAPPTISG